MNSHVVGAQQKTAVKNGERRSIWIKKCHPVGKRVIRSKTRNCGKGAERKQV